MEPHGAGASNQHGQVMDSFDDMMLLQHELFADSDSISFDSMSAMVFDDSNYTFNEPNLNNHNFYIPVPISVPADAGESSGNGTRRKKQKKYQRHTEDQIRRLESVFKDFPHPDEGLRIRLSDELGLKPNQVKFWFQNKRTLSKAQAEHDHYIILKGENDKLRHENEALKKALGKIMCQDCGSSKRPAENAENGQLRSCAGNNVAQPPPQVISPPVNNSNSVASDATGPSSILPVANVSRSAQAAEDSVISAGWPNSGMMQLAKDAMNELLRMSDESSTSLWTKGFDGRTLEKLNYEEYLQRFRPLLSTRPSNFVPEASKDSEVVISPCQTLVEVFMSSNQWIKMFASLISAASTIEVIASGTDGTRNGTLLLLEAELQVLSPMVPPCKIKFLRYCKKQAAGKWAVVDVSADSFSSTQNVEPYLPFRLLPSGCIIDQVPNGFSKVTCISHYEYDENAVGRLYRATLRAGMGFGSTVWLAKLRRQCETIALFTPSAVAKRRPQQTIPIEAQRGLLELGQRMSDSFCYGICGTRFKWDKIQTGTLENESVCIHSRISTDDDVGEPSGIVLSARTSLWLPVAREHLFHHLKNQWDLLCQGSDLRKILHLGKGKGKGHDHESNRISVFRSNKMISNETLVIQETWSDASASAIVYAPLDASFIRALCESGETKYIPVLPSGFAIYSDGIISNQTDGIGSCGSLLTVGFQVVADGEPADGVDIGSINILNKLISLVTYKIKSAMGCT